ncbi:sulfate transporter/antisigma-factor antagonist STAS domain protein [Candidatus Magnetomorum sp. HK-1]|nr:sulfate transporter/antisigma-factor antagonist STAS domain protein [Candidatus Magnetomorum sp. HK-1]
MKIYEQDKVTVYEFETNIIGDEAVKLQDKLNSSVSNGKKHFCFQMGAVDNIDSVGVCVLLALKKQLGDKGVLDFQNVQESVESLLKIIG